MSLPWARGVGGEAGVGSSGELACEGAIIPDGVGATVSAEATLEGRDEGQMYVI